MLPSCLLSFFGLKQGQFSDVDYGIDDDENGQEDGEGGGGEGEKKNKKKNKKRERTIHGWAVTLRDKRDAARNLFQQWRFTPDGSITNKADPEQILTHLGETKGVVNSNSSNGSNNRNKSNPNNANEAAVKNNTNNDNSNNNANDACSQRNDAVDALGGERFFVATFPHKFLGRDARLQRWAWQQEALENFGQWRNNAIFNRLWHKKRLTWPGDANGEMVEEGFDWPIKGFLVNGVPRLSATKDEGGGRGGKGTDRQGLSSVRRSSSKQRQDIDEADIELPPRLYVLPNGANPDVDKAQAFVPEDGARLWKELNKARETYGDANASKKESKYAVIRQAAEKSRKLGNAVVVIDRKLHRHDANSSSAPEIDVHCRKCRREIDSLAKLQFRLLLDAATKWLNPQTRVQRIFKVDGTEVFEVKQFSKGDIIFGSTGRDWIDGRRGGGGGEDAEAAEAKTSRVQHLVDKMERLQTFQRLRDCEDLVLEVEGGSLAVGAKIVVNPCCLSEEERDVLATPQEYLAEEEGRGRHW